MAKTLKTTLKLYINALFQDALDLSTPEDNLNWTKTVQMATGTGVNQADRIFHDQRTLTAGNSETLDLSGGGLLDTLGGAFAPAKVKLLAIFVDTTTTGAYLLVGGNATNQFLTPFGAGTDKARIGPNSPLLLANTCDGFIVTPATGDILKIDNPSLVDIDYDIVIIGTSA